MNIVITGGAGFIGSALTRHLVSTGSARITVIDKLTYAANLASLHPVADNPRYRLVQLDICDGDGLRAAISEAQPDWVFHLAAESHVDRSITGSRAFAETNMMGTYQLLEAVRAYWQGLPGARQNAFRMVHVSTDEVFGSLGLDGAFREDTAYDPSSPYSATKAASDHLARAWQRTYGLPVVVSNCSNNYGPYHFPEKLIPLTILNALSGQSLPVYGDGLNIRDWLYVEDHVDALVQIATAGEPGQSYGVGGNTERTNLAVVETICDMLDEMSPATAARRQLIKFVEDRPGHDRRYAIDATFLRESLGWQPQQDFTSGLQSTIAWYIANEAWWRPLRDRVYGGERLGLQAEMATPG